uniref:Histidine-rich glycoprotein n=1 Tax=Solanum tuberosum TaxID=4113 RepID=M1DKW2_SOLTU
MSSIASDPCDYYMGYYDCNDGVYGCEDDGDYGGYDDSHDQEPNGNESYYSRGEYEKNGDHSYYGEDGEDDKPCDGSYDDDGACERSYSYSESENCSYDGDGTYYTSHSKDEGTSMMGGETRVPNKEPTIEGVMDALLGCPNIPKGVSFQGKEDLLVRVKGELACFNSPMVVDHSLFKYNVLFEDDEITPNCPPKDGNLFLEDESTRVGKDYDEKEGGICFIITSSSLCVPILKGMTNDFEPISSHTYENTLDEVVLQ